MALLKALCWALIFIVRIRFPPGSSIATVMAYHSFSIELYCFPATYTSVFRIDRRFSIGLRSGEQGGQIITLSSLMPIFFIHAVVYLAARAGALPCINSRVLRSLSGCFFRPRSKILDTEVKQSEIFYLVKFLHYFIIFSNIGNTIAKLFSLKIK